MVGADVFKRADPMASMPMKAVIASHTSQSGRLRLGGFGGRTTSNFASMKSRFIAPQYPTTGSLAEASFTQPQISRSLSTSKMEVRRVETGEPDGPE